MKPMLLSALLFSVVGCAASRPAAHASAQVYSIESLEFHGLPPSQLAIAREKSRADSQQRVLARNDVYGLTSTFSDHLRRDLRVADGAPLRLRIDVSLASPGQFEGFAPENADLSATAQVLDANGVVVRTVRARATANAPLQRSASRRERFEAALSRLSQKLAQQL
jgi:hypothetical protein